MMSQPFGYSPMRYMGVPPPPPKQQGGFGFPRFPRSRRISPSQSPDYGRSHIPMSQSNNAIYTVMHSHNPRHSYDEYNQPRESILRSPSYDPLPMSSSFSRSSSRSRSRSRRPSPSPSRSTSRSHSRSRSRSLRRVSFAEDDDGFDVNRTRRNSAPSRSLSSLGSFGSFKVYDDRSPSPAPRNRSASRKPSNVSRDSRGRMAAEDSYDDRRFRHDGGNGRSSSRGHSRRPSGSGRESRSRRSRRRSRHGRTH